PSEGAYSSSAGAYGTTAVCGQSRTPCHAAGTGRGGRGVLRGTAAPRDPRHATSPIVAGRGRARQWDAGGRRMGGTPRIRQQGRKEGRGRRAVCHAFAAHAGTGPIHRRDGPRKHATRRKAWHPAARIISGRALSLHRTPVTLFQGGGDEPARAGPVRD